MRKGSSKPFRIIGAYDSETTNTVSDGLHVAFPVLHQLGLIKADILISHIDSENVEESVSITMFRHTLDLFDALDGIVESSFDYVPVILCHNLAFDMYGLSSWLSRHDTRVLAKSARKPITFTVCDESGAPSLVIWDTLVFSQQPLARMGADCGYLKAVGEWDYDLVRTPQTPLTANEREYAAKDIFALLAWFGWWIRRNPDIDPSKLGLNVVTKTGVVRERRRVRFDSVRGKGHKYNVGRYFMYRCRSEAPKDDDELFTMLACTRGGFTFVSSENASVPFDCTGTDRIIAAYDATSQHPAQLVSKLYPVRFRKSSPDVLDLAFNLVGKYPVRRILDCWEKPFPVAFNACFEFTNIRPRKGSIFERYGVFPLASARYRSVEDANMLYDEDNGDRYAYIEELKRREYRDTAENAVCAFGKLISADKARFYITELTAWEIWQAYEWDSVKAVHGYLTGRFTRPSDMDVISVMQFYKAKDRFKHAREMYFKKGTIDNPEELKKLGIPSAIVSGMENGTISDTDVNATYQGLKADLNSIFGISVCNEFRRDTVLTNSGIEYQGEFGICNAPKNPKVWYQFGQRIVGWSRIAQICAIELIMPYSYELINGDTDSIKVVTTSDALADIESALAKLGHAIDRGKRSVCKRVKLAYPELYDDLQYIGYYVHEFSTERFCASWNKAYCTQSMDKRDGEMHFDFTLAGIPTKRRGAYAGVNGFADDLYGKGWSFLEICDLLLGYNVTYAYDILHLNARSFPQWGDTVFLDVEDHLGNTYRVIEPAALALYPMSKTVNDTGNEENRTNMLYAKRNRPSVNTTRKIITEKGIVDFSEVRFVV